MRIARVRALIFVCALALIAGVATAWAVRSDSQQDYSTDRCESGDIEISLAIPDTEDISLIILNGTDQSGLADQAAQQLEERGFNVVDVGDSEERNETPAIIYSGPETFGAGLHAWAYFHGGRSEFSLDYDQEAVTIILGSRFQQVKTESDARLTFATRDRITAPEGTCSIE
ncbi:LytR C-terminal domain-containing protein [Natronoglycomyces albus]|uniref:LytR C-terminal domain-containing protein n=1 Tax=Natronoglycomyces albus TaxID=2811108 RepID=A0A895XSU2_9ACTN|nr:LytR C-terminal domain-containing protein [Natronoglycomyces albus]QSB06389.1 LytR C-terminal domain-containing protein [Natronoglycomyces albus]